MRAPMMQLVVVCLLQECGGAPGMSGTWVFNGEEVADSGRPYPWVAQLLRGPDPIADHVCGGVVVDPHWILTAAHCLRSPIDRADVYDTGQGKRLTIGVVSSYCHESYDPDETADHDVRHDLALVRIADPATAPIPHARGMVGTNDQVVVFGWGPDSTANLSARTLRVSKPMPVLGNAACNVHWQPDQTLQATEFCAGSQDSSACVDDSGGPAVVVNGTATSWTPTKLVGILSLQDGACNAGGIYDVYTGLDTEAQDWMRRAIADIGDARKNPAGTTTGTCGM